MKLVLLAAVGPVWPVNGDEAGAPGLPAWLWVALAVFVALGAGATISYLGWRDRRRTTPEHRAFRAMAWRLRLGRRSRAAVEQAARAAGMEPVALLISERAFDAAAGSRPVSEPLARVRERVFAAR